MYPEYYRKGSEHIKGSNADAPEPFRIGISFISLLIISDLKNFLIVNAQNLGTWLILDF